ncbi:MULTISPECIES: hypothetical protein [Pseudomonas]|uniref:Uncharacterized protein n=1 Tax=Pseudomonas asplenii TaxID=53407 RepID=A0A0M9GCY2_9PSED|nr:MULTISPECIES: hypothetical protein [Pseudomonas]KPA88134.1 hypothetical protein PF66_05366 [Pseudomonas fuscovaginae]
MLDFRKWALLFVTTLALLAGFAQAEERPPVADKVLAYSGQQGVKVWTLRIGERSDNQALVQVEDVDHDWNLRIQKMNVEKTAKDTRYSTTVDGQKFVVLILQEGWGELYLPGESKALTVGYDENLSSRGDAQAFLTEYLKKQ